MNKTKMKQEVVMKNLKKYSIALEETGIRADEIKNAIEALKKVKSSDGTVFTCGNGGSAGNASHFASDILLTSGIKSMCLNDNPSIYSALINDKGWDNVYLKQLEKYAYRCDCLVVFSVHGGVGKEDAGDWSTNLNRAIDYAKKMGMTTIGFSGATGGYFNICDYNIIVESRSTPVVEGLHSVLGHLIAFLLVRDEL